MPRMVYFRQQSALGWQATENGESVLCAVSELTRPTSAGRRCPRMLLSLPILDEKCRIRWWKFDTSLYADRRGIASGITIGFAEIGFDVGSCVTTGSGIRSNASST